MQCGNYSIDIPDLKPGEQYRFHFDATACVGCHCCEVACNEQNANDADIKWRRVGEMETGSFPDTLQIFNSMSCNHCIDPECLRGCPTNSHLKLDNGIVFHEDESYKLGHISVSITSTRQGCNFLKKRLIDPGRS